MSRGLIGNQNLSHLRIFFQSADTTRERGRSCKLRLANAKIFELLYSPFRTKTWG
jgi:hypothetical protein